MEQNSLAKVIAVNLTAPPSVIAELEAATKRNQVFFALLLEGHLW